MAKLTKAVKAAPVVPVVKMLDNEIQVVGAPQEYKKKDGTQTFVVPVSVAGEIKYAWASRAILIRGNWVVPNYQLRMKLYGATDQDFQEYTAKDGHKYVAAKIEGEVPQGLQVVGWRSKFDPTVVLLEVTVWPDYKA